jgi:hypothetical protein
MAAAVRDFAAGRDRLAQEAQDVGGAEGRDHDSICCNATDTMCVEKGPASGGDAPFGSHGLTTIDAANAPRSCGGEVAVYSKWQSTRAESLTP